jgi:predicted RNA methylase
LTASGDHSVNALTGPADQCRHEAQWQKPITAGVPVTLSLTLPQKQLAEWVVMNPPFGRRMAGRCGRV